MEAFNSLAKTLSWLLDHSEGVHDGQTPPGGNIEWHLQWFESKTFEARLDFNPTNFIIKLSDSVWPSLVAFSLGGIEWQASEAEPRHRAFVYSPAGLETWVKIAEGNISWTAEESSFSSIRNAAVCEKQLRFPLTMSGPPEKPAYAIAAFYGCLWLIAHEAAHAWKSHYKLIDPDVRSSVQNRSMFLKNFELNRTIEAEADWAATEFVYFYVLDSITSGHEPGLAYLAGFGIAATILMLAPDRQYLLDVPLMHDPSWMRIHNLNEAAKSGFWHLLNSSYPGYYSFIKRYGPSVSLGRAFLNKAFEEPSSRFFDATTRALHSFNGGQYDALRFAEAIGDAARQHKISGRLFDMGDRHDWKELASRVMDSDVLAMRLRARKELSQLLPADPRFQGHPLGQISGKKFAILSALNLPQEAEFASNEWQNVEPST